MHVGALDPVTASNRLRRGLAGLESGLRSDTEHGRLRDSYAEAAAEDAYLLADRIARGEARLYTVSLSITVHAPGESVLAARMQQVQALAAGLVLDARHHLRALGAAAPPSAGQDRGNGQSCGRS